MDTVTPVEMEGTEQEIHDNFKHRRLEEVAFYGANGDSTPAGREALQTNRQAAREKIKAEKMRPPETAVESEDVPATQEVVDTVETTDAADAKKKRMRRMLLIGGFIVVAAGVGFLIYKNMKKSQ